MPIAVDRGHAPEVHVSNFQGTAPVHSKRPIGWAEVIVNTGVHAQHSKAEVFVGGQLKEDIISSGGLGPIQGRLGVSGQIVSGLIPNR